MEKAAIKENKKQNLFCEGESVIELLEKVSNNLKKVRFQHGSISSGSEHVSDIETKVQNIKDELKVKTKKHEIQSAYERHKIKRDTVRMELSRLKEESEIARQKIISDCSQIMSSSISTENSSIAAVENMLGNLDSTLGVIELELSDVVKHEQMFSSSDRWNQIHSVPEAKIMLDHLFDLLLLLRCQLWDKEYILKEKDFLISGYEEYISNLNSLNEVNIKQKSKALNNEGEVDKKDDHFYCACSRNSTCRTRLCECHNNKKLCKSRCHCSSKCLNRKDSGTNV